MFKISTNTTDHIIPLQYFTITDDALVIHNNPRIIIRVIDNKFTTIRVNNVTEEIVTITFNQEPILNLQHLRNSI